MDSLRLLLLAPDVRRDALSAALARRRIDVCALPEDVVDAVLLAHEDRPDACVLDLAMAGDVLGAVHRIAIAVPDAAIVLLAGRAGGPGFVDAVRAGATGYVGSAADAEDLADAVLEALRGSAELEPGLVRELVDEFRTL
jgi:DNA-binding NarL/FixJ family response regulator